MILHIKPAFAYMLLLLLLTGCHKDYFKGITDLNNWRMDMDPTYGIAVVNADINYESLIPAIKDNKIQLVAGADKVLHIVASQNILSIYEDMFKIQDIDFGVSDIPFPGGKAGQSISFPIPISVSVDNFFEDNDIGIKAAELKSITIASGEMQLSLKGEMVNAIGKLSLDVGGIALVVDNPTPLDNTLTIPIPLAGKTLSTNGGNMEINLSFTLKSTLGFSFTSLSLSSSNMVIETMVIGKFNYDAPVKVSLALDFFDKLLPEARLQLRNPQMRVSYANTIAEKMDVEIVNFRALYMQKDESSSITNIPIDGSMNTTFTSNLEDKISNLLKRIDFTAGIYIDGQDFVLSQQANFNLNGEVDIPLDMNIKNLDYDLDMDLPSMDTSQLKYMDTAWVSTYTQNTFPLNVDKCHLVIVDKEENRIDSVVLEGIFRKGASNPQASKVGLGKTFLKKLLSGNGNKGIVALQLSTAGTDYVQLATDQRLLLKMGLAIRVNGKNILEEMK